VLGFQFQGFGEGVSAIWDALCQFLAPVLEVALETITETLEAALQALTGLLEIFSGVFSGDWEKIWQGVADFLDGIWQLTVRDGTGRTWSAGVPGVWERIPELSRFGTVKGTDAFRSSRIRQIPKVQIGVSVKSGIMDLSVTSREVDEKELLALLDSYTRKKKYYRLKNYRTG
jgi:hypothetical protein